MRKQQIGTLLMRQSGVDAVIALRDACDKTVEEAALADVSRATDRILDQGHDAHFPSAVSENAVCISHGVFGNWMEHLQTARLNDPHALHVLQEEESLNTVDTCLVESCKLAQLHGCLSRIDCCSAVAQTEMHQRRCTRAHINIGSDALQRTTGSSRGSVSVTFSNTLQVVAHKSTHALCHHHSAQRTRIHRDNARNADWHVHAIGWRPRTLCTAKTTKCASEWTCCMSGKVHSVPPRCQSSICHVCIQSHPRSLDTSCFRQHELPPHLGWSFLHIHCSIAWQTKLARCFRQRVSRLDCRYLSYRATPHVNGPLVRLVIHSVSKRSFLRRGVLKWLHELQTQSGRILASTPNKSEWMIQSLLSSSRNRSHVSTHQDVPPRCLLLRTPAVVLVPSPQDLHTCPRPSSRSIVILTRVTNGTRECHSQPNYDDGRSAGYAGHCRGSRQSSCIPEERSHNSDDASTDVVGGFLRSISSSRLGFKEGAVAQLSENTVDVAA
jgi:hypothetical protein